MDRSRTRTGDYIRLGEALRASEVGVSGEDNHSTTFLQLLTALSEVEVTNVCISLVYVQLQGSLEQHGDHVISVDTVSSRHGKPLLIWFDYLSAHTKQGETIGKIKHLDYFYHSHRRCLPRGER